MSFWKRILHALIAFFYLRFYEALCAFVLFSIVLYVSKSIDVPPNWQHEPRPLYAASGALAIIGIYYFLFRYFFVSLATTLVLGVTPFFRRLALSAVNSLTYAVHALWVIHGIKPSLPPSIWAVWAITVIFDGISPALLPSRLLSPKRAESDRSA